MATYAANACDIAESQIGIHESPMGSNEGGCEKYQRPWGTWMVGEPWCGAFDAWVWEQAGMDGMGLASPSTATMCDIARSEGLICSPRMMAAFVICGTHCGLLHHSLGGSLWQTIEGNSNDQVRWVQRNISGFVIYAPPEISKGSAVVPPATQTWYYLEDVHQKGIREFGGWSSQSARDKQLNGMKDPGHYRPFKRNYPTKKSPYFFEDPSKDPRYYGGWTSKKSRDNAKPELEDRLGRNLRTFSVERPISSAQGGDPGKTT
jgi:hypothetical protein